jgi:transcriptional regulator with XRE-family HTH domain
MIRLKIDYWRQQRGFSQGILSRLSNVDEKTVQKILRDPYANISLYTLDKIATALDVPAEQLIEWMPGDPPSPTQR